ncbi:MAG: T9SS type A sorting domain-containing protein [Bacteroidia bacterium]
MKQQIAFSILLGLTTMSFAQKARLVNRAKVEPSAVASGQHPLLFEKEIPVPSTLSSPTIPIGTVVTDVVTATKIGESSNAFTFTLPENNQLSVASDVGTNGGSVAFIYRQNISQCGGTSTESGKFRYSISTDGGVNWNTNIGCYGLGPVNPYFSQQSRYPNITLFLPPGQAQTPASLKAVYSGPVLNPVGSGWDGAVLGLVSNVTTLPVINQEIYPYQSGNQYFSYSLIERVPGEFWTVAWSWDGINIGNNVHLNKGVFDPVSNQVNWTLVTTLSPDYYLGFNGSPVHTSGLKIAFSPDGMTGYVAMLSDLVGNQNRVYAPCFASSTDGGQTWSNFEEFNMSQFYNFGLLDSLSVFFYDINTTTTPPDTIRISSAATTGEKFDLIVDKNGNPHLVSIVGSANMSNGNGTYSNPNYSIFEDLGLFVFDFTKDSSGDWNMLYLSRQATFRGTFGDQINVGGQYLTTDPWMQASRSPDGSKVFFSWTESDTTGIGGTDNSAPDLITAAFSLDDYKTSDAENRTITDANWASKAIMPKISPVAFYDMASTYILPTVVMDLQPGISLTLPVSFYYFSDIDFHDSDFNTDARFFSKCNQNPIVNSIFSIQPGCGLSDGMIWVQSTGGNGSYTYLWSPNTGGATSDTVSGVPAGIYQVTVSDSLGCIETNTHVLTNNNSPVISSPVVSNVSCFGLSDGEIQISLSGGTPPYNFIWSNGANTQNLIGLPAGTYDLVVNDSLNCTSFATATVLEFPPMTLTGQTTDVLCAGDSDGAIDISVSGGTMPLSFSWNTGATTEDLMNLTTGNYSVSVTDSTGCTVNSSFLINQPSPISMILPINQNTVCSPIYTGNLYVIPSGGTPPYVISWTGSNGYTNTSNTPFIFALPTGIYQCYVTDANGCMADSQVIVQGLNNLVVSASVTDVSCGGVADGSIAITASGGTGPYSFLWNTGDTTQVLSNLPPGNYSCIVTNAQGCAKVIVKTISVSGYLSLNANSTSLACFGDSNATISAQITGGTAPYTYLWSTGTTDSTLTGVGAGIYSLSVSDSTGCVSIDSITIIEPPLLTNTLNSTPPPCMGDSSGIIVANPAGGTPPYSYLWSTGDITSSISNLTSGTYSVTITDANNCTIQDSVTFLNPPVLTVSTVLISNVTCPNGNDGQALAVVTGGVGPYQYLWTNGQTTDSALNLFAMTYLVFATDAYGCMVQDSVVVEGPPAFSLAPTIIKESCGNGNGSISTAVSGGTAPYTYSWSNGATTPSISGLSAGIYTLTLTDDLGCVEVNPITLVNVTNLLSCQQGFVLTPVFPNNQNGPGINFASSVWDHLTTIYPNPTDGLLYVKIETKDPVEANIFVQDLLGRQILEMDHMFGITDENAKLDLSRVASGTYIIRIGIDGGYFEKKIILIQ